LYTTSPDSISLAICVFIHVKQYTIEKYAIALSTPTQEGYTKQIPWEKMIYYFHGFAIGQVKEFFYKYYSKRMDRKASIVV